MPTVIKLAVINAVKIQIHINRSIRILIIKSQDRIFILKHKLNN